MSAVVAGDAGALPVGDPPAGAPGRWGMALLVATEGAFFAYLLFSYFYIASSASAWPPRGRAPELALAGTNTAILLASSVALWWGESGIRRGRQARLRAGALAATLLGATFLAIQLVEYRRQPFTPQTDAYGSLFFTITGFHGAHVAVGLLMLVVVQLRAWLGHFDADHHLAVSNAALYWHFVDAVWIAVFTSLYLFPHAL